MAMIAQHNECTKSHRTAHFKMVILLNFKLKKKKKSHRSNKEHDYQYGPSLGNKKRLLSHADVTLGELVSNWNCENIIKGTLKDKIVAIVKIYKDPFREMKLKFWQEAKIFEHYHHPNVLLLTGVHTKRQPIYIIKELVPGGDFLSF